MKVIIDTNILISAALSDGKPEQAIESVLRHSDYEWIASAEILQEYLEVLNRPKLKLSETTKSKWLSLIQSGTRLISTVDTNTTDFPRDPKDAKFIALAIATEADFFITGDKDFREIEDIGKTAIVSVSFFLDLFA